MSNPYYQDKYSEMPSNRYSDDYGHKDPCKGPCKDHRKDDCKNLFKRIFAQFVSQTPQEVDTGDATAVRVPKQILSNTNCITLVSPDTIRLEPGIYSVAYHVTIKNRKDDDETFTSFLSLNGKTIKYSESSISLERHDKSNIGSLSKTILIEVRQRSFLQLFTKEAREHAKYTLTNASIAIEKIC